MGIGAGVVLLAALWIAVTGALAVRNLAHARTAADALQAHLVAYDTEAARADLTTLQREASHARARTHDPLWYLASHVPWLGRPLRVERGLAAAADDLAQRALPGSVEAAEDVGPRKLRAPDGRIDVAALRRAASASRRSAVVTADVARELDTLPRTGIRAIDSRVRSAQHQVDEVAKKIGDLSRIAAVVPGLLGADGKRTYFVVFQNNAEVRGTGGLPGAWAVVSVDDGRIHLDRVGNDGQIPEMVPPVKLPFGRDFADRYVAFASDRLFVNANMTAHFPSAAYIFREMWRKTSGQQVDGVLALDPIAESYLLPADTAIPVPGRPTTLNASNFVSYVESQIYADFPNVPRRKAVLAELAGASFRALIRGGHADNKALVSGLRRAAREHRLLLWSADPKEQAVIDTTEVSGFIPEKTGPFLYTVLNNASGSKLDYYLKTDVVYTASPCGTGRRRPSKVTVTITNTAPTRGLPPYVTIRADYAPWAKPGAEHVFVSMYVTPGAELTGVRQDGREDGVWVEHERGHPVYTADMEIPAGKRSVVTISLDEPRLPGPPQIMVQPAVLPTTTTVHVAACR